MTADESAKLVQLVADYQAARRLVLAAEEARKVVRAAHQKFTEEDFQLQKSLTALNDTVYRIECEIDAITVGDTAYEESDDE